MRRRTRRLVIDARSTRSLGAWMLLAAESRAVDPFRPLPSRRRQLCFNVGGLIARNAHVWADPTDLDGNRIGCCRKCS